MAAVRPLLLSGREVYPLIEGGKGISISTGESSGAWAACGGVGTFSGVNADSFDLAGRLIPRGGVLMIRRQDTSSFGFPINLRYAITSRTSLRS